MIDFFKRFTLPEAQKIHKDLEKKLGRKSSLIDDEDGQAAALEAVARSPKHAAEMKDVQEQKEAYDKAQAQAEAGQDEMKSDPAKNQRPA